MGPKTHRPKRPLTPPKSPKRALRKPRRGPMSAPRGPHYGSKSPPRTSHANTSIRLMLTCEA
eukprot:6558585-Pyramimonas_sp.AAC.1